MPPPAPQSSNSPSIGVTSPHGEPEDPELANLLKFRALLEAVRQATEKIHLDLAAAVENHRAILAETERTACAAKTL